MEPRTLAAFATLCCLLAPAGAGGACPTFEAPLARLLPGPPACWEPPASGTVVELLKSQSSAILSTAGDARSHAAVLALSSGDFDAAYSAGLLVGWGETGVRPAFSIVTAVGASALIAPFAFLGADGDQKIGDLFNCPVASFKELAEQASRRLDAETIAAIAKGHRDGRRLYLVAPSAAGHPAVAWDIGRLAAGGEAQALNHVKRILAAVVDRENYLSPRQIPGAAGRVIGGKKTLRATGAGRVFFVAPEEETLPPTLQFHYFLVNNGKLDAGGRDPQRPPLREAEKAAGIPTAATLFLTAPEIFSRAQQRGRLFHFSCIPRTTPFAPRYRHEIDPDYSRALFLRAWRTSRAGGGWRSGPWEAGSGEDS